MSNGAGQHEPTVKSDGPPPRDIVLGFAPYAALVVLLGWLEQRHFDSYITTVFLAGAATPWNKVWKHLPGNAGKYLGEKWAEFLATPNARWIFGSLFVAAAGLSLLLASIHVETVSPPQSTITLYRYEQPAGDASKAQLVSTAKIDGRHPHSNFRVWNALSGKHVWIASSALERTDPLPRRSWSRVELVYPQSFKKVVGAALLPMEDFLPAIARDRPMRVVVTDESGITVAEDSLRDAQAMPALMLSFIQPPPLDSATALRWNSLLQQTLGPGVASDDVAGMVTDWMNFRWLRTTRDLKANERLTIKFLKSTGEVLASPSLVLTLSFSDVIVRRT